MGRKIRQKIVRVVSKPKPYFHKVWRNVICAIMGVMDWNKFYFFYARHFLIPLAVRRKRGKKKVRVVFLPMAISFWKYGLLCGKMCEDDRFDVLLMPVMRTNQPLESQIKDQDEMLAYFVNKGYKVIPSYDKEHGTWNSLADLKPDLIFYTQPYSGSGRIRLEYDYFAQRRSLICFSPYGFGNTKTKYMYDNVLQNVAWRVYAPTAIHAQWARELMRNKGYNVRISGYYFEDEYRNVTPKMAAAAWSKDVRGRRHVIWSPHHSFPQDDCVGLSTFMETYQIMREIAYRYRDEVFFAFKPHPVLRSKLCSVWTKEKVDEYYSFWDSQENTMFLNGAYLDLFKGSDALIHDCDSFLIEYLYTQKPALLLVRENSPWSRKGIGVAATKCHYKAYGERDIINFIEGVVLKGEDRLQTARNDFYKTYLQSSEAFSDSIINDIVKSLCIG